MRVNEPNFTGTPMPKDEPLAPNPPLGAMIDYSVAAPVSGPVVIQIFDSSGALVNRFSSDDKVPPLDLSKLPVAPEWVLSPKPPVGGTRPPSLRLGSALSHGPPGSPTRTVLDGVWAPPGRYTVEVDVGGQQLRQPLDIVPDPRIRVTQADFEAQFRLARQIEQSRARVRNLLKEASALEDKLKGNAAAQGLVAQIDALTGLPVPTLGSAAPETLQGISDRLDELNTAVEGSDGAPSPDALKGYALSEPGARGSRGALERDCCYRQVNVRRGSTSRSAAAARAPSTGRGTTSPSSPPIRRS